MPRKSISSSLPTATSPSWPNSPPSNTTRSNDASLDSAANACSSSGCSGSPDSARASSSSSAAKMSSSSRIGRPEHVVALDLHLGGQAEQRQHRRQEDRGGLAAPPGPDEPADCLGEEQRRRRRGGVDTDRQPRHVDALADHPHRDHPPRVALGELRRSCGWPPSRPTARRSARSPLIRLSSAAYARAESWSVAMTRPPASGTCRRTSLSRRSAASSTAGTQAPSTSRAVRSACADWSLVSGSPSRAATSSPARVRHATWPEYAMNSTGRTTWSASASAYP